MIQEYPNNIYPAGFIGPLPPGATRAPATSPDLLKGSTAKPKVSTSVKTEQPIVVPQQVQQQSNPMALFMAMNAMQSQFRSNNAMMTQRNLLLKHLYDTPLTNEEINQLDPTMKDAVLKNDRDQIDMSLRLISDEVQGRNQALDSSFQFLTKTYVDTIEKAEQQRQQSQETVLNYAKALGAPPSKIAEALGIQGDFTALDALAIPGSITKLDAQSSDETIPTITNKPRTDVQNTALGFAQRMADADKIITEIGGQFTGWKSYIGGVMPNILKSDDRQRFEQAQRNFINAVLRKESGAAISPTEFDSAAKQYFPQPGDSQAVVNQKADNRRRAISGLAQSANTLLSEITGETTGGGSYEDYLNAIK